MGYFHYVLLPHRYDTTSGSSDLAEIVGDDMIVSLYCANSDINVANTIRHELGHNLGLHHGGFEGLNYKPNYNSVMNYRFQFPGVDNSCDALGDNVLDYSSGEYITLDESSLLEPAGVCGSVAIDWNTNGVIESGPISQDINNFDGFLSVLQDFDDWANLVYDFSPAIGAFAAPQVVVCDNPAPMNPCEPAEELAGRTERFGAPGSAQVRAALFCSVLLCSLQGVKLPAMRWMKAYAGLWLLVSTV